ncbi:hypothetical protein CRYUN_Cryun07bG0074800 [Craigia yunnanensis]
MASMPFSATFPSHLHDFFQTNPVLSSLWPSLPFLVPSIKSSLGSSKSTFLQHGFSLQSLIASGFVFKSRSSGIYAKAATKKTLYNYTVKDIDGKDVSLSKLREKFGGQELGSNPKIKHFACTRFKAEFPIFDKVDVNGPNTAHVY